MQTRDLHEDGFKPRKKVLTVAERQIIECSKSKRLVASKNALEVLLCQEKHFFVPSENS